MTKIGFIKTCITALLLLTSIFIAGAQENRQNNSGFFIAPYILEADSESAVIAFELEIPMDAEAVIFDGDEKLYFSSPEVKKNHFIKVDGLEPGRLYQYEVTAGNGKTRTPQDDPGYSIKTAGQMGDSFHFAVFGDHKARRLRHKPSPQRCN